VAGAGLTGADLAGAGGAGSVQV